jgi:hypothetical protein
MGMVAVGLALGQVSHVMADVIPYPNVGTPNPVTYTFTAAATGSITAYFAGSTAGYDNELGLLVNGVSTGVVGLDDHASAIGQSLILGSANAGDTLVFVLVNNTLGEDAYSDPAMNVSYDTPGETLGHNHVYSTSYTATSPVFPGVPVGTYVAFEDLPFPGSDFNYYDENFVFTNVAATSSAVPLPAAAWSGIILLGSMIARQVRRRRSV